MANFVTFKNAHPPFEGQPIALNLDLIKSISVDYTADFKTCLYSAEMAWHVQEDLETVLKLVDKQFDPSNFKMIDQKNVSKKG